LIKSHIYSRTKGAGFTPKIIPEYSLTGTGR